MLLGPRTSRVQQMFSGGLHRLRRCSGPSELPMQEVDFRCSTGDGRGVTVGRVNRDLDDWTALADKVQPRTHAWISGPVAARSGATRPTVNPATGVVLADVAECDEGDVDLAVTAGRKAFDQRRLGDRGTPDQGGRSPPTGAAGRGQPRGAGAAGQPGRGQAHRRHQHDRRPRLGGDPALVRREPGQGVRRGGPDRGRRPGRGQPRAAGRRRRRGAVELPAGDGDLEARPRAGRRQQRRAQAGRGLAALRAAPGRARGGGRAPRRRARRRAGGRPGRRPGARPAPGGRRRHLHRVHGHRPAVPAVRRAVEPQAGVDRGGRQERRCRPRRRLRP